MELFYFYYCVYFFICIGINMARTKRVSKARKGSIRGKGKRLPKGKGQRVRKELKEVLKVLLVQIKE